MELYKPVKSTRKYKKYMIKTKKGIVHFGDNRYQHFKDTSPLKLYSNLNHNDPKRKKNYLSRHHKTTSKTEALKNTPKTSAKYWATKFLW